MDAEYAAIQSKFEQFLDADEQQGLYATKIRKMLAASRNRLEVNLNDLRQHDSTLAEQILQKPMEMIPPFESALEELVKRHFQGSMSSKLREDWDAERVEWHIAVEGSFGSLRLNPREMLCDVLTKLVCVEGIVTRVSLVRPKVMSTVHYCEATKKHSQQIYRDATSFKGGPTSSVYPTRDEDGNPLVTEFGLSRYKDNQRIWIQDMPERSTAGQLPRSIEMILDDDLVDCCKPGDRIQAIGVYRALASYKASGESTGMFRTVVIGCNVRHLSMMSNAKKMTEMDIRNIRKIAKREDAFDVIARSVAPSIHGHPEIKKGVALLLLGGVEKNLKNGAHIRGDINMLMVGDPSTAKSQMLRSVLRLAPLAINTTGRGSSGVGLTAAVTSDPDTGERRLEAGAMVLADRGVVCIDEFDKMGDSDRTAIHEVMEQQTVTVAKAGIHTSLNARCSVVAAANPIYGQYDRSMRPEKNIALPDSLLSRFDLLFIVLDKVASELDKAIAEHVLNQHRYRAKGGEAALLEGRGVLADDDAAEEQDQTSEVFQKFDKLLHGAAAKMAGRRADKELFLSPDFLKKYIDFAKTKYSPDLTEEAARRITDEYVMLRSDETGMTLPITARCLESIVRLSSAHAKCRLSKKVTVHDVEAAMSVVGFALRNEAAPVTKGGAVDDIGDEDYKHDDNDHDNGGGGGASRGKRGRTRQHQEEEEEEEDLASRPASNTSFSTSTRQSSRSRRTSSSAPSQSKSVYDPMSQQSEDPFEDESGDKRPSDKDAQQRATKRMRTAEAPSSASPPQDSSSSSPPLSLSIDSQSQTQTDSQATQPPDHMDVDSSDSFPMAQPSPESQFPSQSQSSQSQSQAPRLSQARIKDGVKPVQSVLMRRDNVPVTELFERVNESLHHTKHFSQEEFDGLLEHLERKDKIMVRQGKVVRLF